MANTEDEQPTERAEVGSDLIIPVAAVALALYYFTTIIDSPWTAQVTAFFVGIILILLSIAHVLRAMLRLNRGDAQFSMRRILEPASLLPQRAMLFALTVGSLLVMSTAGFTLTAIVFLSSAMLLLNHGRNPVRIVVLAVSLSVVWFILFVLIFQRRFPLGWLDEQISAIVRPLLKSVGLG
ncbi:MAG: tripartite tricarboxylate transporter TctB family protein [Hyphomicrobiaceae bacterium]